MKSILRNVLAVIAGLVIGSVVNMGIITIGPQLIPPPPGVDVTDMESLARSMHLFGPEHFIAPFLAHALGTLVGAIVAALLAASYNMRMALIVGGFFLLGGITNVFLLPAPLWFDVLDVAAAYLPMGWLGGRLAGRIRPGD